jgi:hypothetical protein
MLSIKQRSPPIWAAAIRAVPSFLELLDVLLVLPQADLEWLERLIRDFVGSRLIRYIP